MITKRLTGLVAVALMLLLFSCGKKSPDYTKYIPKEANYVVGIDVKNILEKLEKDSMSVENIINTLKAEANPADYTQVLGTYNQLKDAGVDWASRVYLVAEVSGAGSYNIEMVAGLKDAQKFEAFLKKQPQTQDIKKGDGFSYTGDAEKTIGWNKDAIIVVYTPAAPSFPTDDEYLPDSLRGMSRPPSASNAVASADRLKKYFTLDKSASIGEAEGFNDLQVEKGDVVVYSQTGDISKNMPFVAMMPKLKELIKGYSTSVVNFENGKIVTHSNAHLGKELANLLKKYAGPEVDLDLIENYPSNNINGVMAFSFKPELIPGLIRELGFEGPANMGLQQSGLTIDEVGKIFKGDFAVVVSDFGVKTEVAGKDAAAMGGGMMTMPTAKVLFIAKLGDKAVLDKLLKMGQDKGIFVRNGNSLAPNPAMSSGGSFPYAISIANEKLVFATDSTLFNGYQASNQKIGLPSDVKGTLKGKAISGFIDFEKILAGVSPTIFDTSDAPKKAVFDRAKATFKNGWYTMGNLSGNTIESNAELNFVNKDKNSLAQLVSFALFTYEQHKAQLSAGINHTDPMNEDEMGEVMIDSISAQ